MTMPHLTNCSHQGEGWCLECVAGLQARLDAKGETTWTHDISVELLALLERLRSCDGKQSDSCIVVWEQCQLLVSAIAALTAQRDALLAACRSMMNLKAPPDETYRLLKKGIALCPQEQPNGKSVASAEDAQPERAPVATRLPQEL